MGHLLSEVPLPLWEVIPLSVVWEPDTTLRPTETPGAWEANPGPVRAVLAGWDTGKPTLAVWHQPTGARITQQEKSLVWVMEDGMLIPIIAPAPAQEVQVVSPDRIRAVGALGAGDEVYHIQGGRIKHDMVIPAGLEVPDGARYLAVQIRLALSGCEVGSYVGRTTSHLPFYSPAQAEPVLVIERGEATDSAGRKTHVTYQWANVIVVDPVTGEESPDPERVDLLVMVDADWYRDAVGEVVIDPTVSTSTSHLATAQPHQRKIDRFKSNGVLFALLHDGSNLVCRYSSDNGQMWQTPATGANVGGYVAPASCYIDEDDFIHVVAVTNSGAVYYLRGTPNASRTSYTWSVPQLAASPNRSLGVVIAHREGTGWKAHIINVLDTWNLVEYERFAIVSNGTITQEVQYQGISNPANINPFPSIALDITKKLHAIWNMGTTGSGKGIRYRQAPYSSGSWSWGTEEAVTESEYANQMGPCAVDSQGRVVVAFRSSGTGNYLRVYRRGITGGWTDISPVNQPGQNPTVAIGPNDEICLIYINSGLKMRKFDGTAWQSEVTLDSDPTCAYPSARRDTSGSTVDVLYTTGSASPYAVKSYRLALNQPPQAPSNLTRSAFDATEDATFTWTHNDPDPGDGQSAYQLQVVQGGNTVVDTGWVQSPNQSYTLLRNTLVNGQTYQWRVRTKDQSGVESPWSDYATFQTGPKPVATPLSPTAGAVVNSGEITVQWSVPDQSSATVRLYDATGTTLLATFPVTQASARTRTITGLQNNTSYQWSIQVTSGIGVVGDEVFSGVFAVQYTPPPKPSAVTLAYDGTVQIAITNPEPTQGEPAVLYNDVYQLIQDDNWVRIATGVPVNGTYKYVGVGSGVVNQFRVRAIGENGTYADSDPVQVSVTFDEWRFTPENDPDNEVRMSYNTEVSWRIEESISVPQTESRYRRQYRGPTWVRIADVSAMFDSVDGLTAQEWRERLLALIQSGTPGYLRGPTGDCWYGTLSAPSGTPYDGFGTEAVRCVFREQGGVPRAV